MIRRKIVRIVALAAFSFAAVFNLLGGLGTSCVAINPGRFESMASLAPYASLYWIFTAAGAASGLYGIIAVMSLGRRASRAVRHALISLLVQLGVAGTHAYTSLALRGSGAPADMRAIVTLIALILIAIGIRLGAFNPTEEEPAEAMPDGSGPTAEITGCAFGASSILLVMERLMALTHTFDGTNYASEWHVGLLVGGLATLGVGTTACLLAVVRFNQAAAREGQNGSSTPATS